MYNIKRRPAQAFGRTGTAITILFWVPGAQPKIEAPQDCVQHAITTVSYRRYERYTTLLCMPAADSWRRAHRTSTSSRTEYVAVRTSMHKVTLIQIQQ